MTVSRRTVLAGGLGLAATAALGACTTRPAPAPPGGHFVLGNVRIFDGERMADADSVLVRDGLIADVGRALAAPASFDGGGRTLLPGLIDAHVHSTVETARDAVRFGVTTQLDMAGTAQLFAEARPLRERTGATDAADLWSGALVTVPGGHGDFGPQYPTLKPDGDPDRHVAQRIDDGADWIKIVIEDGRLFGRELPTFDGPRVAQLVAAANRRGIQPGVHVTTADGARTAIEAGARLLVHVPQEPVDAALTGTMRQQGAAVIATLSVAASSACTDDWQALRDDPLVSPYLDDEQRRRLDRSGFPCFDIRLDDALRNVAALREAGVPVLAGTDAGNPGTTYGASMVTELGLLVRAGLSATEALTAATALPAGQFGLADRGRIARGLRADLLLVNGDPTTDVRAIRDIAHIWKNGHPISRTP